MPDPLAQNKRRAVVLALASAAIWALVGLVIGALLGHPWIGLLAGAVVGGLVVLATWWFADDLVVGVTRAHPSDPRAHARFQNVVEGLCVSAGLGVPRLYVVDDPAPNALVTGARSRQASLVVTSGLLDTLGRVELEGVVAHELSHLRAGDPLPGTLAVVLAAGPMLFADLAVRTKWWNGGRVPRPGDLPDRSNPISWLAYPLFATAPACGLAVKAFAPPRRDLQADEAAVALTRYPPALAKALLSLRDAGTVPHAATTATAHLWLAQPLSGLGDRGRLAGVHRWFDTHPPLDERITVLEEM